jgi:hypothetical protein
VLPPELFGASQKRFKQPNHKFPMPKYIQNAPQVLPEGIYPFEVINAKEKLSLQGNEMIELQLSIQGSSLVVYDNLVFTPKSTWKVDDFRRATGEVLASGVQVDFTAQECLGRCGKVSLVVENFEGRPRNKVMRYIIPESSTISDGAALPPSSIKAPPPRRLPQAQEESSNEERIPF